MTTCPSCSRSVPDEALACPACGATLDDESTPTGHQPMAPHSDVIATLLVIAVFRFGLLTTMVWQLVFVLSVFYAFTTDLSIWYANRSIFPLLVLVGLASYASYGAYVSLGDQQLFKSRLPED